MTAKPDRKTFMMDKLRKAMGAIQSDSRYDWTRTTEAICEAASSLMKMVEKYIDGKASEAEVKPLYKAYVNLHLKA